jgi:predicted nucleic acid-binding protein
VSSASVLEEVPPGAPIILDTSVLLAHLGGHEPIARRATELVEMCLCTGRNDGVVSAITVAELLVRPLRSGPTDVDLVLSFLWSVPDLLIRSVDFLIAAEAARIRAETGLAMPDSLILATGLLTGARLVATNDRALADAVTHAATGMEVLLLSR